ncbi:uncharacterized protein BDCG_06884 [Blastomyces dermatitidis ER-3]|uniref:Extracellular membrane protein CFEM domain-containing protein n=1 Tax=Ajellomyces dermatitidis (strain ER-3 / ATCC MYA-2586) TaxID=559297 RepID=A0ABP2F483_AJEDR|nr:uncharacterized protein BDCG_06884 [Blastomyces dermatitidis ER-3]EEQ91764.1 hypothetical protein BDCG_06884 [Blastomyces dermatitidis ER-3]
MSRRFPALAVVLQLAVAVHNPFCLADHISPRATTIPRGGFVPACAQGCLLSFLKLDFPAAACPNSRDLSCLCTRRSTTGFTLGEGALRCVYAFCLNPGIRELQVYAICSGIRNALPNTHTAITITSTAMTTTQADPSPSTTVSETTLPTTSTLSTTYSSTLTTPTISSTSATLLSTALSSSSTLAPLDPTGLPPGLPEPPAANDEPSMTSAQVIGASIGGAVAGASLLALIILLLLKSRRKRMMAAHESEFEIGGQMSEPTPQGSTAGYRGGPTLGSPIGIYNEPVARRLTHPSNTTKQSEATSPDAGNFPYPYPAYSHSGSDDASLSTPNATKSKSPRRISQLLPEKPNYEVYSSQHPITERLGRRPESSATVFEEDYDGDRKALLAANSHWPTAHPGGGYKNMSAYRNYSQPQQFGIQYTTYQNTGRHQPQHRQRPQPPTLRLVTPARSNSYQGRTNMATSPPKVMYQRVDSGLSMRSNGTRLGGHPNLYPRAGAGAGAGAWRHGGSVDLNRRRPNDRTSAGSVTSFESVDMNDGNRNGNAGIVPKRTTVRLSPVRERPTSPDPNAYPAPLSRPVRYPPMNGRSASTSYNFQGQGYSERVNDVTMGNGANGGNSRLYPYPYPYPYRNPAGTTNNIPKFPKFHQPLRPPIPRPQPESQTQPQPQPQPQHQYSPPTLNEPRNSRTSSNSNSSSNNSLLSKRRGEAMADKMESELDVDKASRRRPSPLNSGSKSESGAGAAAQGGLRTPLPSVGFKARQNRQAQERQQQKQQQQQGRRDRDMTDDDNVADVEQQSDLLGSQGRKLTPTRRGPDLYLNVE